MNLTRMAREVIEKRERWQAQADGNYATAKYQDYLCARANLKDSLTITIARMRVAPLTSHEDHLDHVAKAITLGQMLDGMGYDGE